MDHLECNDIQPDEPTPRDYYARPEEGPHPEIRRMLWSVSSLADLRRLFQPCAKPMHSAVLDESDLDSL